MPIRVFEGDKSVDIYINDIVSIKTSTSYFNFPDKKVCKDFPTIVTTNNGIYFCKLSVKYLITKYKSLVIKVDKSRRKYGKPMPEEGRWTYLSYLSGGY
jgi:hypothetical protein